MWRGECDVTASQLLAPDQDDTERSAREEAITFLRDALADGPRPAQDCQRDAATAGLTAMTLRRARATLHVVVTRRGEPGRRGGGSWWWALPLDVSDLDVQAFTVEQENTLTGPEANDADVAVDGEHLNQASSAGRRCRRCGRGLSSAAVTGYCGGTNPCAPVGDLHCRRCGADVEAYGDGGVPYCREHFQEVV
jgi:hypothetical protein